MIHQSIGLSGLIETIFIAMELQFTYPLPRGLCHWPFAVALPPSSAPPASPPAIASAADEPLKSSFQTADNCGRKTDFIAVVSQQSLGSDRAAGHRFMNVLPVRRGFPALGRTPTSPSGAAVGQSCRGAPRMATKPGMAVRGCGPKKLFGAGCLLGLKHDRTGFWGAPRPACIDAAAMPHEPAISASTVEQAVECADLTRESAGGRHGMSHATTDTDTLAAAATGGVGGGGAATIELMFGGAVLHPSHRCPRSCGWRCSDATCDGTRKQPSGQWVYQKIELRCLSNRHCSLRRRGGGGEGGAGPGAPGFSVGWRKVLWGPRVWGRKGDLGDF